MSWVYCVAYFHYSITIIVFKFYNIIIFYGTSRCVKPHSYRHIICIFFYSEVNDSFFPDSFYIYKFFNIYNISGNSSVHELIVYYNGMISFCIHRVIDTFPSSIYTIIVPKIPTYFFERINQVLWTHESRIEFQNRRDTKFIYKILISFFYITDICKFFVIIPYIEVFLECDIFWNINDCCEFFCFSRRIFEDYRNIILSVS